METASRLGRIFNEGADFVQRAVGDVFALIHDYLENVALRFAMLGVFLN